MIFDKITIEKLIKNAKKVRQNAFAPYSGYKVGAALLTASGKIYIGCNVENAAFGAGICAERSALAQAVADGEQSFIAIAVIAQGENYCTPCGVCRQALAEFSQDMKILCCKENGEYKIYTLDELLPFSFNKNTFK